MSHQIREKLLYQYTMRLQLRLCLLVYSRANPCIDFCGTQKKSLVYFFLTCIFANLTMPQMDGYEVLKLVKEQRLDSIIVVSSGDMQPEARKDILLRLTGIINDVFINAPGLPLHIELPMETNSILTHDPTEEFIESNVGLD